MNTWARVLSRQLTVAAFLLLIITTAQSAAKAQDKAAKIDALISSYLKAGKFNGSALVADRGKVVLSKGYGMADFEWDIRNTPDTKFRLGSITKQFTSMLIMQLVNEGKIRLDGKLSDYLPYYRKDTGDKITIHNLLTHTSGIPNYTSLKGFFEEHSRDPYGVKDFVVKFCSGDLEFEPGSKWNYSNSGYFILGAIIEQITGKTYEQVLQERILDPVGLKDTGYDHHDTILKHRASGYEKTPKGLINAAYLDMTIPYAAGSLYSTVEDLYKWDQALYTEKLLPENLKKTMWTPFLHDYAYGWGVSQLAIGDGSEKVPVITHGGGINGFNTVIVRMVDEHSTIILLNNEGVAPLNEMSKAIASILHNKPYKMASQAAEEKAGK